MLLFEFLFVLFGIFIFLISHHSVLHNSQVVVKNKLNTCYASREMPVTPAPGREKQKGKVVIVNCSYREAEASLGYERPCLVAEAVLNSLFVRLVTF